jgi:2-amino-4-hydroxy-6-hydroxymethyldihydropteridine diphosphokinase
VTQAFLALGSNLGDRGARLQEAVDGLARAPGTRVVAVSRVYETEPVGGPDQGPYLNAVVEVATDLDPHALLAVGQQLERSAQRVRGERWGPRTLDVDVLLYDEVEIDTEELVVPHPRMWERAFVMVPLHDIAADLVPDRFGAPGEGVLLTAVTLTLPWTNDSAPSP